MDKTSLQDMKFSVLIPVYIKENPIFLDECLKSMHQQSLKANEIVIVEDGPITKDLATVIENWRKKLPIKSLQLEKNQGLGVALAKGVIQTKHEIIARMDADDIAEHSRFEDQMSFLKENSHVDIVGGWIGEFETDPKKIESERRLPTDMESIEQFSKLRSPLNHMTVVFRKSAILKAGNYQPRQGFEDYYLWARVLKSGSKIANLPKILVRARAGNALIVRRGGVSYLKSEIKFQMELYKLGFINVVECVRNMIVRGAVRIFPKQYLKQFYAKFLRA